MPVPSCYQFSGTLILGPPGYNIILESPGENSYLFRCSLAFSSAQVKGEELFTAMGMGKQLAQAGLGKPQVEEEGGAVPGIPGQV
ncbi:hypothetical protein STEG23_017796 [Scotinomys teguina]